MWSARSACTDRVGFSRVLSACGVVSVVGALSVPITLGLGPEVVPIRIHAAEGWGRPAVDSVRVYFLSKRHELIAVARESGVEKWRAPLGSGTPLTAGTTVLVAGATVVAGDGDVFGIDRDTGAPKWRFTLAPEDAPGRYLGEATGGLVLTGSRSGRIYGVDAESGALRWVSASLGDHTLVYAPAADADDVTNDDRTDEREMGREGRTAGGERRERREKDVRDLGTVAVTYTDFSTTPRSGGVVLLDAARGSVRWRTPFPHRGPDIAAGATGGPVLTGPVVAAASGDGTVYGFDRHSGAVVWTVPPVGSNDPAGDGAPRVEDVRALASARRTLVVTSLAGTVVAVDPRNGSERWRSGSPLDGSVAFAAVTDGRLAYLPHVSGWLVAVDLADGLERWRVGGSAVRFEHPPAVVEHRVYVTSAEGLYAFDDIGK